MRAILSFVVMLFAFPRIHCDGSDRSSSRDVLAGWKCPDLIERYFKHQSVHFSWPREGEIVSCGGKSSHQCVVSFEIYGSLTVIPHDVEECLEEAMIKIEGTISSESTTQLEIPEFKFSTSTYQYYHSVRLRVVVNAIASLWVRLSTYVTVGGVTYDSGYHNVELFILSPLQIEQRFPEMMFAGPGSSSYAVWEQLIPHDTLDYIEIGTSNFDTIAGWVSELSLFDSSILTISGMSIEPVSAHLNSIPSHRLGLKVNAAVMSADMDDEIASIYFFLVDKYLLSAIESDESVEFLKMLQGCTCVNYIHPTLRRLGEHVGNFSLARVQKDWVRTISIPYVLSELGGGRDVGLVKLDVEGLDIQLMHEYLDYLVRVSTTDRATARWPCVFAVEIHFIESGLSPDASNLIERLSVIHGYTTFQDGINLIAINCQCTTDRILGLLLLLGKNSMNQDLDENIIRNTCHHHVSRVAIDTA